MLQSANSLPVVPLKPAPWDLQGQGWVIALKLPANSSAQNAFLPPELVGKGKPGLSLLMFVDYAQSACGPYRELLFIPGTFAFADGRRHMTISRILVSTWDSVVNGRKNWGIPKDRADFNVDYNVNGSGEDHIQLHNDGRNFVALRLKSWPLSLPVHSGVVPASIRTLAQRFGDQTFLYAPSSHGWVRPGRLLSWRFDATLFPDLAEARIIAAIKISSFHMRFPVAQILPGS